MHSYVKMVLLLFMSLFNPRGHQQSDTSRLRFQYSKIFDFLYCIIKYELKYLNICDFTCIL